jgi:carboxypeptidase C (cathepsin A)
MRTKNALNNASTLLKARVTRQPIKGQNYAINIAQVVPGRNRKGDICMLNDNLIDLSDMVSDCESSIEKVKLVLSMIVDKYGFSEKNEEQGRNRIHLDADKIITFLFMALDYANSTDTELKEISMLLDNVSEPEQRTVNDLLSQINGYKIPEQYDLTFNDVKEIVNKNNRGLFEISSDSFIAGFIRGQEAEQDRRKKVSV